MVYPARGGWLVTEKEIASSDIAQQIPGLGSPVMVAAGQKLYRLPEAPDIAWPGAGAKFGDVLTFMGSKFVESDQRTISVLTAWHVEQAADQPLKVFVHAQAESGDIVGQWDGLDVDPHTWRIGDLIIQRHEIILPDGTMPAEILVGVYDSVSAERLGEPVSFPIDE
jgi:hypothetical protein